MSEEVDGKVILRTQETLGKYIRKPPLNEKLLKKPPFKFLHDVITSVISNTGFMSDVFTPQELNSDNVKDKDSKILFLQKAIDYVVSINNEPLKIRPSKTVAGQEAEKTNIFLQALAKAIESSLNDANNLEVKPTSNEKKTRSSSQSRKAETGEKSDKKSETPKGKSKSTTGTVNAKSNGKSKVDEQKKVEKTKVNGEVKSLIDKKKIKSQIGENSSPAKERTSRDNKERRKSDVKDSQRDKSRSKSKSKESEKDKLAVDEKPHKETAKSTKSSNSRRQSISNGIEKTEKKSASPKSSPIKKPEKNQIISEEVKKLNNINNGASEKDAIQDIDQNIEIVQKSQEENGRIATAKLNRSDTMTIDTSVEVLNGKNKEEKVKENQNNEEPVNVARPSTSTIRKASARPSTARPAAPRVRVVDTAPTEVTSPQLAKPVTNIILDGEVAKDDDENEFQVEEFSVPKDEILISTNELENKSHGSLVTQILETKKDLENGSIIANSSFKQDNKTILSESARRKEREILSRELEKLREGIQKVTSSANPLGKLIGYLQEDIDIMTREIEMWRQESGKMESELIKEESKADIELERLNNLLQNLDDTIESQLTEIFTAKARTLQNNERTNQIIIACI